MYDADAIEAINFEQLVTATDRLLLRGYAKRRPSAPSLARPAVVPQIPLARGSQRNLARACDERTAMVRPARAQVLATTIVIPALFGIALGLAALL